MKRFLKLLKLFLIILLTNQLVILLCNSKIEKGNWKNTRSKRFNEHDFLNFSTLNLNWSFISEKNKQTGIIHFYTGKKLLISNISLTEWYLYENKNF